MRIAVIGTGISGLVAAEALHEEHDLAVFEAGDHIGGHTSTVDVELESGRFAVDTGFVVFNDVTYPNFVALLDRLGVASRPTSMSFSVRCERTGLEYCGTSLNTLFAQRRNLVRPSFYRMLADILRFNRESKALLATGRVNDELGTILAKGRYSREFIDRYIVPMGAAIWSTSPDRMLRFPARFFLQFLSNHGLLGVDEHLQWRTVEGGSRTYVEKLTEPFRDRIRLRSPVLSVRRETDRVAVCTQAGGVEEFDEVVFATHSDQALSLLEDPSDAEVEILGAIPYQDNAVVLHTDSSLLPRSRRAWASWNYHILRTDSERVVTTYNMSKLQGIDAGETFCVTLNRTADIDPARVIRTQSMAHPMFTPGAIEAQKRHHEISGVRRTHYCGAYWRHGFHEDGVVSGLRVAERLGTRLGKVA
jgi:predicted NAD/FAD-binding protein